MDRPPVRTPPPATIADVPQPVAAPVAKRPDAVQRWRLVFRRRPDAPALAQREAAAAWEAALAATQLPLVRSDAGEGTRPKLAFGAAPGGGLAADADLVDLWLLERRPVWQVREALADRLPDGHELVDLHDVWLGAPSLPGRVEAAEVEATLVARAATLSRLHDACAAVLAADQLPRQRMKGDRSVDYDLRPFIETLALETLDPDGSAPSGGGADGAALRLSMRLRYDPEKGVGRPDEVLAELSERIGEPLEVIALRRARLILVEDGPAAAPKRRPGDAPSPRRARR